MDEDFVVPAFAKKLLPGLTVARVTEEVPHSLKLEFTDGSVLIATSMPFKKPELDIVFVQGIPAGD